MIGSMVIRERSGSITSSLPVPEYALNRNSLSKPFDPSWTRTLALSRTIEHGSSLSRCQPGENGGAGGSCSIDCPWTSTEGDGRRSFPGRLHPTTRHERFRHAFALLGPPASGSSPRNLRDSRRQLATVPRPHLQRHVQRGRPQPRLE